jgi:acetylornithine/succinyldiaminopimelate/putrescine aminotransferase
MGLEIVRAKGVFLYDKDGKDYIDLVAGVSVANLGHDNQVITKAVKAQVDKYLHLMVYGEFIEEPQVKLASLLSDLLPKEIESTYLVNSGSEAIEGAMKLAKRHTGRYEIVSCKNAYHGSTQGAMSLMSDEYYTDAFRPLLPGISHIEYNNFDDLKKITEKTACVIIEPVQGEAGIISPEREYLPEVRKRCNQTGTLLVFDEIQTGFGRTGELFAFRKFNVEPDILVTAKALGGGMPIGAFSSSKKIMDTLISNPVLGHITTFGGHPVSAAAAFASLEYITKNPDIIKSVTAKEKLFKDLLTGLPQVKEIRSNGLLMAVDLGNSENLFKAVDLLQINGIHTDWFLFDDHSFRISPPLTITNDEIKEACKRIKTALKKL